MIASYPGLPSQLFSQLWQKLFATAYEKSCEGRPGYEANVMACQVPVKKPCRLQYSSGHLVHVHNIILVAHVYMYQEQQVQGCYKLYKAYDVGICRRVDIR